MKVKPNKKLYAAYGSNLNIEQMKWRCPTAKLVGIGEIKDYDLQFKGKKYGAFATITPQENSVVPVALWELTKADEQRLDVYEGFPSHYFKENVVVDMGDEKVEAMVYRMNLKMRFGIPSQPYYDTVFEGYMNCKLDTNVLNQAVDESIEKCIALEKMAKQYVQEQIIDQPSEQMPFDSYAQTAEQESLFDSEEPKM